MTERVPVGRLVGCKYLSRSKKKEKKTLLAEYVRGKLWIACLQRTSWLWMRDWVWASMKSKQTSKTNQNPSRYIYNSIISNLKFQHRPNYSLSKNPQIKIELLTRGPKSLQLYYTL